MENEIFEKLKIFIYDLGYGYILPFPLLFKKKIITKETKLELDLGITGDDSDSFFKEFSKEFNVDISNFKIGEYFGDEGDYILPSIIKMITGKKTVKKKLTINNLVKAVLAGRLDEEIINS